MFIRINNLDEMREYYNSKTNTYEFYKEGSRLKVSFAFDIEVDSNIAVGDIKGKNIKCNNIDCCCIHAGDIECNNFSCYDIHAGNIECNNFSCYDAYINNIQAAYINSNDIECNCIDCRDVYAEYITAMDIDVKKIIATDISCFDLTYCSVCLAHSNIKCNSISGKTKNSKHFVLDGKIEIKGVESE